MPSYKVLILIKIGLKLSYFCYKILSTGGKAHTPEIAPQPLPISCYELDAEHSMRLALSDVEPRFQKLLKRNGNKYLIKLLFFWCCFVTIYLGHNCSCGKGFYSNLGRRRKWLRNTALAQYAEV